MDAAIAQGPSAVTQLVAAADPNVAADLLKRATSSTTTASGPASAAAASPSVAGPLAAQAALCWGTVWYRYTLSTAGVTLGWVYASENGWCGDGTTITWHGGPSFADYAGGPYCVSSYQTLSSWDVPYSWIHVGAFGSLGISYPWGCGGLRSMKATVRVAANGYYDYYNDFGI